MTYLCYKIMSKTKNISFKLNNLHYIRLLGKERYFRTLKQKDYLIIVKYCLLSRCCFVSKRSPPVYQNIEFIENNSSVAERQNLFS